VVAAWTGIPVTRLLEGEMQKLVALEGRLHERVVGQDEAVEAVSNANPALALGSRRPRPADWLVPVPGADGRRQDRARTHARRPAVRR